MAKNLRIGKGIDQKIIKGFKTFVDAVAAKLSGGSKNIVVQDENEGVSRMTILKISKERKKAG